MDSSLLSPAALIKKALRPFAWFASSLLWWRELYTPVGSDWDLWWHLAAGRYMAAHRLILREDVFTHTLNGTPWVNFEWLGQLGLHGLIQTGGFAAVLWMKILLSLAAVGLVTLVCRRAGARGWFLLLLSWAAFLLIRIRFNERIELVSFVFLPLFLFLILLAREGRFKMAPVAAGVLVALWCNIHAGYVYALAAAGGFCLGARWNRESRAAVRRLDLLLAVSVAATFVNAFGYHLHLDLWRVMTSLREVATEIDEWKRPGWRDYEIFWFFQAVFAGAVVAGGINKRLRSARFWIPAVVLFVVIGMGARRSVCLPAFVGLPFLAALRKDIGLAETESGAPGWLKRREPLLAAGLIALLAVFQVRRVAGVPFAPALDLSSMPEAACRFLLENRLSGRLYNTYSLGGYLDYRLTPKIPTFQDGRQLFAPFLIEEKKIEERFASSGRNEWPDYLNRHRIGFAVVLYFTPQFVLPDGPPFPVSRLNLMFPRSDWAVVFWDDTSLVFARRTPENRPVIDRHEWRSLVPHNHPQMRLLLSNGTIDRADAKEELDRYDATFAPSANARAMRRLLSVPPPAGS